MRLLTAVSGVRVPQQAPSSPQGELRNNSPFLGELFACMPAAPLRVAKMQDVRCAPRSCGTIAPLSHFCSAGRLRRGFFPFYRFFLEPPDAVFALHDFRVQIRWRKLAIPSLRSLPRYNPKQKGHCPPQHTPFDSPKHHNILCFFFPQISLAVSPFPDLTAKYSQSRFHTVFPRFFSPFELPVSAPLLRSFCSRKST